jgi:uracil-DNA glycosylase
MSAIQEERFRRIFQALHAEHPNCLRDEWLSEPCRLVDGELAARPIVWSRRNGSWLRSELLWIGAAPGNAGGKGRGDLGAHGTRIPFGGDIAGGNLDALLASIGLDRNRTFLTASFNQLPATGGGEPSTSELAAPVGSYPNSYQVIRETVIAVGPRLIVLLGNVALRALFAAARLADCGPRMPALAMLHQQGLARGQWITWPEAMPPDQDFLITWRAAWPDAPLPALLWLTHPSAQNMSPFARVETLFHSRFIDARTALRTAVHALLGWAPPNQLKDPPHTGIYALPEWRSRVGPRHTELVRLWRSHGL